MLDRYGSDSPVLFELRDWYIARCEELGQSTLSGVDCVYNRFRNGRRISDHHRLRYRRRQDLMSDFPDPFATDDASRSYFHWYRWHGHRIDRASFLKLIRNHAPPPALQLARSARVWPGGAGRCRPEPRHRTPFHLIWHGC